MEMEKLLLKICIFAEISQWVNVRQQKVYITREEYRHVH